MSRVDHLSIRSKIALGTFSQIGSRLAIALLSILTLRYSTQYLGADLYGQYATVIAYVTIFTLLTDLGLTAIASREIAKRPADTEKIIGNSLAMRLVLSVGMSPFIVAGGWWLYASKPDSVKLGIALLVVTLILGSVQSVASALFTARHRNDIPALLGLLNKVVYLLAIVAAGSAGLGFYGFIYAAIFAALVSAGLAAWWAAKHIRMRLHFHRADWTMMMRASIPLGIIQIINMLYYKIDSIMLSVMRSPAEVGLYAIAYGIIDVIVSVPSLFMTSLMPSLATATKDNLQAMVRRSFNILAFFAFPIAMGGVLLSRDVILLISNKEFLDAATPFAILAAGTLFSYLNAAFGFAAVAVNKQSHLLKVSLFTVILNVAINLLLIPRYGVSGAATATLITEMVAFVGIYLVFWRQTGISVELHRLWKPALAAGLMIPAKLAVDQFGLPTLFQALLLSTLITIIYLAAMTALRAIPSDILDFAKRIIQKRKG